MNIYIIGPGGVGKTTSGKILAKLLNYRFIDLDEEFCEKIDNIGKYIISNGYKNYCYRNSFLFYDILNKIAENNVIVLSSGFLVHEGLDSLTQKHLDTINNSGLPVLLLPSKNIKTSAKIVVQRQVSRNFGLNAAKEKEKILQRFPRYLKYGEVKIFSHDHPESIAHEMKKNIFQYLSYYKF